MGDSGTEKTGTWTESSVGDVSPGALAEGVVRLTSRKSAVPAGDLPMWNRRARPRRPFRWSNLLWLAGWSVTLALAVVALLRIVRHDAAIPLVWLNAFTLYVYLPAYAVLAAAIRHRRRCLLAASGVVVACHLAWVAPDLRPATPYRTTPVDAAALASPPVRIFYANVHARSSDRAAIVGEIADADPDVVVLVEVDLRWFQSLQKLSVLDPYRYGTDLHGPFRGEVVILSRLPVSRRQLLWYPGRLTCLVDVRTPNQTFRLIGLHSPRPLYQLQPEYFAYWEKQEAVLAGQPEPLVVIGDFNATQHSRVHQRLTSARLRSAHVDRGRGYATTWPNGLAPVPPIRIDHALLSPQVECLSIREGRGAGSDHKPLILDVRVHGELPPNEAVAGER